MVSIYDNGGSLNNYINSHPYLKSDETTKRTGIDLNKNGTLDDNEVLDQDGNGVSKEEFEQYITANRAGNPAYKNAMTGLIKNLYEDISKTTDPAEKKEKMAELFDLCEKMKGSVSAKELQKLGIYFLKDGRVMLKVPVKGVEFANWDVCMTKDSEYYLINKHNPDRAKGPKFPTKSPQHIIMNEKFVLMAGTKLDSKTEGTAKGDYVFFTFDADTQQVSTALNKSSYVGGNDYESEKDVKDKKGTGTKKEVDGKKDPAADKVAEEKKKEEELKKAENEKKRVEQDKKTQEEYKVLIEFVKNKDFKGAARWVLDHPEASDATLQVLTQAFKDGPETYFSEIITELRKLKSDPKAIEIATKRIENSRDEKAKENLKSLDQKTRDTAINEAYTELIDLYELLTLKNFAGDDSFTMTKKSNDTWQISFKTSAGRTESYTTSMPNAPLKLLNTLTRVFTQPVNGNYTEFDYLLTYNEQTQEYDRTAQHNFMLMYGKYLLKNKDILMKDPTAIQNLGPSAPFVVNCLALQGKDGIAMAKEFLNKILELPVNDKKLILTLVNNDKNFMKCEDKEAEVWFKDFVCGAACNVPEVFANIVGAEGTEALKSDMISFFTAQPQGNAMAVLAAIKDKDKKAAVIKELKKHDYTTKYKDEAYALYNYNKIVDAEKNVTAAYNKIKVSQIEDKRLYLLRSYIRNLYQGDLPKGMDLNKMDLDQLLGWFKLKVKDKAAAKKAYEALAKNPTDTQAQKVFAAQIEGLQQNNQRQLLALFYALGADSSIEQECATVSGARFYRDAVILDKNDATTAMVQTYSNIRDRLCDGVKTSLVLGTTLTPVNKGDTAKIKANPTDQDKKLENKKLLGMFSCDGQFFAAYQDVTDPAKITVYKCTPDQSGSGFTITGNEQKDFKIEYNAEADSCSITQVKQFTKTPKSDTKKSGKTEKLTGITLADGLKDAAGDPGWAPANCTFEKAFTYNGVTYYVFSDPTKKENILSIYDKDKKDVTATLFKVNFETKDMEPVWTISPVKPVDDKK